jgi:hypothetical protein
LFEKLLAILQMPNFVGLSALLFPVPSRLFICFYAKMYKHPVSIALSNRVLEKIDKEASKQKRSRSKWVELHFETMFFRLPEIENEIKIKPM